MLKKNNIPIKKIFLKESEEKAVFTQAYCPSLPEGKKKKKTDLEIT